MRVLMVGDVVGRPGRTTLGRYLPRLKRERQIDFVIVNGENAAGGFGLTAPIAKELLDMGADVITSGNHIWDKKEIYNYLDEEPRILRPANFPPGVPGRGMGFYDHPAGRIAVINLAGRVFMPHGVDCPFRSASELIKEGQSKQATIFVDFHAEATAEKIALGWHLNGKVAGVFGTHTHIQTADARVLSHGTAYITDLGMVGPYDSVLGMEKSTIIERFHNQLPARFNVAGGPVIFGGVVVDVDPTTGKALHIESIWQIDEESY
ncbi:MAG: TIGR00282 family metallophosphoesterase [Limnochordia bacterium]